MPFYQVLCIAAHNPEYVRDKSRSISHLPLSFPLYSAKSKASFVWRPRTSSTTAASFAAFNIGAQRHFLNACDPMEPTMNTESTSFYPPTTLIDLLLNCSISYWTMHFDASPEKQKGLSKLLRKDPRVIRATVLKMGNRIEDVAWKYPKTIISAPDVPGVS